MLIETNLFIAVLLGAFIAFLGAGITSYMWARLKGEEVTPMAKSVAFLYFISFVFAVFALLMMIFSMV